MAIINISQIEDYGEKHGTENFSPKVNKIIKKNDEVKENDEVKKIIENIININNKGNNDEDYHLKDKKLFKKYDFLLKKNKDLIENLDEKSKSTLIFSLKNIFIVLNKLEKYENGTNKENILHNTDNEMTFSDLDFLINNINNLEKIGFKAPFKEELKKVHDIALESLNKHKLKPTAEQFLTSLKIYNPQIINKLFKKFKEEKESGKKYDNFNFKLEGVSDKSQFKSWLYNTQLQPMYYSYKQFEIRQNQGQPRNFAINQKGEKVEYSQMNGKAPNFNGVKYLGYCIYDSSKRQSKRQYYNNSNFRFF